MEISLSGVMRYFYCSRMDREKKLKVLIIILKVLIISKVKLAIIISLVVCIKSVFFTYKFFT